MILSWLPALLLASFVLAAPYRDDLVGYNLNVKKGAVSPLEYDSERPNSTYTPSPRNWRSLPTYTILMDKFADGDPTNNDFFKSPFEWDWRETQLRSGGDLKGLEAKLDYLQGMGVKVIFMSGTPFLNMLWQADSPSSRPFRYLSALIVLIFQVTLLSTSASLTRTGAPSMTGDTSLILFTLGGCTLWPTSLLGPCQI